jgi:uncharacterized protein
VNNSRNILYAKFKTEDNHYIYDTYSDEILQVSKATWDIIDDYFNNADDKVALFNKHVHAREHVLKAINDIEEGIHNAYLRPCNITTMHFYREPGILIDNIKRRVPQLSLEVTQRCNFRCRYCRYTYDVNRSCRGRDMTWQTALNAIDVYMAHSGDADRRSISFWGGEPLLGFPLIRRIVEHMKSEYPGEHVNYNFTTNASLIAEKIAQFLIDNDFSLLVSLDGPQHIHDRYRINAAGKGTFNKTVEGLQKILRKNEHYYNTNVSFNCVLTPLTDFSEVFSFFSTNELTKGGNVQISMASSFENFFYQKYGTYTTQQQSYLREIYKDAAIRGELESNVMIRRIYERAMLKIATRSRCELKDQVAPNGCCAPLMKKMQVTVDGNIHLCERGTYYNPVGNVNGCGIDYSSVLNLVREYTDNSLKECQHCWAVRMCTACYKDFIRDHKWYGATRNVRCENIRRFLLDYLRLYSHILEKSPRAFEYIKKISIHLPV